MVLWKIIQGVWIQKAKNHKQLMHTDWSHDQMFIRVHVNTTNYFQPIYRVIVIHTIFKYIYTNELLSETKKNIELTLLIGTTTRNMSHSGRNSCRKTP